MARNGAVTWRRRTEKIDGFDLSPSDSEEVHVLAVDDSHVDRKVIERLLRISSCKGWFHNFHLFQSSYILYSILFFFFGFELNEVWFESMQ